MRVAILLKNAEKVGVVTMPNCTRYKPKHSLTDKREKTVDFNMVHPQPNFIEKIMVDCYKKLQEETITGVTLKCERLGKRDEI